MADQIFNEERPLWEKDGVHILMLKHYTKDEERGIKENIAVKNIKIICSNIICRLFH